MGEVRPAKETVPPRPIRDREPRSSEGRATRVGVRVFLFAVFGATAVIPVALLGVDQARRWAHSELEAHDRQAEAAARTLSEEVSIAMLEYVHATATLAAQMAARKSFDSENAMSVLAAYTPQHPEFLGTYVTDEVGLSLANQFYGQEPILAKADYGDREYFRAARRSLRPAISRVQRGRVTHELAVNIGAPILDGAKTFRGVACSSINLEFITQRAQRSALTMRRGRVLLIDNESRTIADSEAKFHFEPEAMGGSLFAPVRSGQAELRIGDDDTGRRVRAIAVGLSAPVQDWRAIALVTQVEIDRKALEVRYETAFASMFLALATLGLAAWASNWISRSLRELAASAHGVTQGVLTAIPPVHARAPREMVQLTVAVRSMVDSLQSYSADLEAQVAARTSELSRTNQDLSQALAQNRENDKRIREDIAEARLFQERMLPVLSVQSPLEFAVQYEPLELVSGDIYDIYEVEPGVVRVFLADATGHGVQAAMRTIFVKSTYDRIKGVSDGPVAILSALNDELVSKFPGGDLLSTASCIELRMGEGRVEVTYANAGNPPLLVFSPQQSTRELYQDGPLLGLDRVDWAVPDRFVLQAGECLLIASDGLIEQGNALRERFEPEVPNRNLPLRATAKDLLADLARALAAFRGDLPMSDDLTMIAILFRGAAPKTDPTPS